MGAKFNENLKVARERRQLTQTQMADALGVAKSTYSLYESGKREPNVQTIKKISDILNVSADELLGLIQEPQLSTFAAHFDGAKYTDSELEEILQFAEFVKNRKNNQG